jgi:hypothetical protein
MRPQGDWWAGDMWPPADRGWSPADLNNPPTGTTLWRNIDLAAYPDKAWDPNFFAIAMLSDFVKETTAGVVWDAIDLTPFQRNQAQTDLELRELVHLIEYRPGVLKEALAQRSNIFQPSTHFLPDAYRRAGRTVSGNALQEEIHAASTFAPVAEPHAADGGARARVLSEWTRDRSVPHRGMLEGRDGQRGCQR